LPVAARYHPLDPHHEAGIPAAATIAATCSRPLQIIGMLMILLALIMRPIDLRAPVKAH
jgi:hypothetical protein